jgi:hypothetical protein
MTSMVKQPDAGQHYVFYQISVPSGESTALNTTTQQYFCVISNLVSIPAKGQ